MAQDPDIMALRNDLETARLRRQIRELEGPLEIDQALATIAMLQAQLTKHEGALAQLRKNLNNTHTARLRERFKCECGVEGFVTARIRCASCYRESWWGWRPPKTG